MKLKETTKSVVLAICILILGTNLYAQEQGVEFSAKSSNAIIGYWPEQNVAFSSVKEGEEINIEIKLKDKKSLIGQINYEKETIRFRFVLTESDELVRLTKKDLYTLRALNRMLTTQLHSLYRARGPVAAILSSLTILHSYPPGEFFSYQKTEAEAALPLCDEIGNEIAGSYDTEEGETITKYMTLGPCCEGNCFGRCGLSCEFPPHPLIQAFSQDCFNHDLCVWETGEQLGVCADEFVAAIDDYVLSKNCNEIAGDWTIFMSGRTCMDYNCADIDDARVFNFWMTDSFFFRGTSESKDGRIAHYSGVISDDNQIAGTWKIPLYMGEECGSQPDFPANGTFTGQNRCGQLEMALDGLWSWYYSSSCTSAGRHPFEGDVFATEGDVTTLGGGNKSGMKSILAD